MPEALGEVAAVQREGRAGALRTVADERFERGHVRLEPELRPQTERVLADLEHSIGIDAGGREARPDEPQGLTK